MQEDFAVKYLALEDHHWWFVGRRNMVLRLVDGLPRAGRILDVGCSGGALLERLGGQGFREVAGVDISPGAIEVCRKKGLAGAGVMDAQDLTFAEASFDVVVASDILEHVSDPRRALQSWGRVLKPGGVLIVFVPAYAFLWSDHDVINDHQKRYEKRDLVDIVEQSGFKVTRCSGWNVALLLPALLAAWRRRRHPAVPSGGSGDRAGRLHALPGPLNGLLACLSLAENVVLQRLNFPAGISFFVVARKKG